MESHTYYYIRFSSKQRNRRNILLRIKENNVERIPKTKLFEFSEI